MYFKPLIAAAVAAAAIVFAAPAAALDLTFLVKVDAIDGVAVDAPTEFYQTWSFDPVVTDGFSPPGQERKSWGAAAPGVTDSPYTADMLAATGLTATPADFDRANFNTRKFTDGPFVGQATLDYGVPIFSDLAGYQLFIDRVTPDLFTFYEPSLAGLTDFFAAVGYANYTERAFTFDGGYSREVTGKAYLQVSAAPAPEPGTWALMIGGFGIAGAALRRRRTATA